MTRKQMDVRIENIYREHCAGIQINIMDIGRVFAAGYDAIKAGADDAALAVALKAVVEELKQ